MFKKRKKKKIELTCLKKIKIKKKKNKNYSTSYSHVISHHSTDEARSCLTAKIGRDLVFSR